MKKIITLTAFVLIAAIYPMQHVIAQAPDKMSYQAVIRDANSLLVTNTNIGIQISILQNSATGSAVYVETHLPTTNANGLVSVEIGTGVVVSGEFSAINWSDGPYFIKSETDLNGGANYTIIGTSQILSVPYALHAKFADSVSNFSPQSNAIMDADGDTKIQVEASPDEDIIRFNMAGTEYFSMVDGHINVLNTGKSVFLGEGAGTSNSLSDARNTAIGYQALHNIGGFQNTALGYRSMENNESGHFNTATGYGSMWGNIEGDINTANGFKSLHLNTSGDRNTAIGVDALYENTTGSDNSALGYKAMNFNTSGNENTAIGFLSDVGSTDLTNATAIGARAKVNQSNSLVLGHNVNVGIGTSAPDQSAILDLNSNTKGFLLPRMTGEQRSAIANPSDGLLVFNTNTNLLNICIAGIWHEINLGAVCPPPPTDWDTVFNPSTGRHWMDRNLGAVQVATGHGDVLAYGDLYQFGRFSDGHEIRTSETTPTLANTSEPNQGNSWDGLFITTSTFPYDWLSSQADSLWQGVNGFNNPCPKGFRIPTESEWEAERQSWISNDKYGAYNSPLKLPAAGYRSRVIGTLWYNNGSYACSTIFGSDTYRLWFESTDAYMQNNSNRATGISVRCIMDE